VIITEKDYKRFVRKYHNHRKEQMRDFYYRGLNYPRLTVGYLIKFASKRKFKLKLITCELPHYNLKSTRFIEDIKNFGK
jgi:hypothetical protein